MGAGDRSGAGADDGDGAGATVVSHGLIVAGFREGAGTGVGAGVAAGIGAGVGAGVGASVRASVGANVGARDVSHGSADIVDAASKTSMQRRMSMALSHCQ